MLRKPGWPGVLVAAVALVFAMTGSAVGARLITGSQIKNSSVTGKDIRNKSLTERDFRGSVRGPQGARGPAGAAGPAGPQGPAGASGVAEIVTAQADGSGVAMAACPSGTRPVSGGGVESGTGYLWVSAAAEDEGRVGWVVAGNEGSEVTAFAYCSAGVSKFTFADGTVGRRALVSLDDVRARMRGR